MINMNVWIDVSEKLPEIPAGEKSSVEVLAGMWIEDDFLRKDHPQKRRFVMGICRMLVEPVSKYYPLGKRWHTFGPAHDDITHWMPVPLPPPDPKIEKQKIIRGTPIVTPIEDRPPQPDELHTYWCETGKHWAMFQFEDWNMCDECAICEVFSDENLADCYDDELSKEELELLQCPIKNS